jgi:hypothetical protein
MVTGIVVGVVVGVVIVMVKNGTNWNAPKEYREIFSAAGRLTDSL